MLEQFGGGGGAQGPRDGGAHEGTAGGGEDVERVGDGGEVGGGEVERVELREGGVLAKLANKQVGIARGRGVGTQA